MLWIVQDIAPDLDRRALLGVCADLGLEARTTSCRAVGPLPDVSADQPVLFYGSCPFIERALAADRWRPCAWYDEDAFRFSSLRTNWGARMLNADAEVVSTRHMLESPLLRASAVFVRPDRSDKALSGAVWPAEALRDVADRLAARDFQVVLARPRVIESEWRLFMVEGRCIASSRYATYGDIDHSGEIAAEMVAFAEAAAAEWSPARAFVMDMAVADGATFILEVNGINSAGFYRADLRRIVAELSALG